MRRAFISIGMLLFSFAPLMAEPKLVEVKKIWDEAPHNAFTDLIRFQGKWYCSFREGTGHAAGEGKCRILVSVDAEKWESVAGLDMKGVDLRDPKLSLTPDGRLMLATAGAEPATRDPVKNHFSLVSFSRDGKEWSKLERVVENWQWLWRVTWQDKTAYGVAYQWDPADKPKKYHSMLYKSQDGMKFDKITDFNLENPTEATLRFDGENAVCLHRRDGKPNSAMLGVSKAPYKEWTWTDLGQYFGGPNFIRSPDGSWWAAGRIIEDSKPKTVFCSLDVKAGKLTPVLTLPSGGDTSYPGMVWHENEVWMSYYSSHEKKSSIYLARVKP